MRHVISEFPVVPVEHSVLHSKVDIYEANFISIFVLLDLRNYFTSKQWQVLIAFQNLLFYQ